MKINIEIDNDLTNKKTLELFIIEFEKQLYSGTSSEKYKSEFLDFLWGGIGK